MNILITGAAKGIGFEICRIALTHGNNVFAVVRNEKPLLKLKEKHSNSLQLIQVDLLQENSVSMIYQYIQKTKMHLDVIINNAGFLVNKPFRETTLDDLQTTYSTNVFVPFLLIQKLLPLLKKSKVKHIVNISSMGGLNGSSKFAGLSAYSSSKGALTILTECLAEELKPFHIIVNALALGAVNTKMLNQAFPGYKANMEASEIANYICDFATKQFPYFNGKVLPISNSTP